MEIFITDYELIMSIGYYELIKNIDKYNNSSNYVFNKWEEYKVSKN